MNNGTAVGLIIAIAVLIVFSAYFSATETAFTGYNAVRMKRLAQKKKSARLVLKMGENYNNVLSTLLIGNNIVNIASASIATVVFTFYFDDLGVTLSTVVMTVLVLIFGEISPKSIAKEAPETFACFAVYPLYFFSILFCPLNQIFNLWKKLLNKIFRLGKKQPTLTEEEFRMMVTEIKDEGVLNDIEHDIIQNTIRYDDQLVKNVMVKADDVTAVSLNTPFEDIKAVFENDNYSRVPVYDGDPSKVAGILYRADFYEMLLNGGKDLSALIRQPMLTTPDAKISVLFKSMQQARIHMAIVVDKNGAATGLVTMEDILEELMGEIEDRYDAEPDPDDDDETAQQSEQTQQTALFANSDAGADAPATDNGKKN